LACLAAAVFPAAGFADDPDDARSLLGVKEGWAWPVIVVPPPEGWESPKGESIKRAMRTAEREISLERDAIKGREVTFMFSSVSDPIELKSRLASWRAMGAAVIVSFGGGGVNESLAFLCRDGGPSLILSGGESNDLMGPGGPYKYLFALDFPFYARANAMASAVAMEHPSSEAAVFTDILSERVNRGADLTVKFLGRAGVSASKISITAYTQDQFSPQVREMESSGVRSYLCWLDAMATISIWRNLEYRNSGSTVYFPGPPREIMAASDGIVVVDPYTTLERDEKGKYDITKKIRDSFDVIVGDPVAAARAYALAKWAISAYRAVPSGNAAGLAEALANASGIPLMGETLSISAKTHRPAARKFDLLRVSDGHFQSYGKVDVFSEEVSEK
jgi:hypothetical protein